MLASFGKGWDQAYLAIGGGAVFAAFMLFVGRRLLRRHRGQELFEPEQPCHAEVKGHIGNGVLSTRVKPGVPRKRPSTARFGHGTVQGVERSRPAQEQRHVGGDDQ